MKYNFLDWGLIRDGSLFEGGGLIDHLRYSSFFKYSIMSSASVDFFSSSFSITACFCLSYRLLLITFGSRIVSPAVLGLYDVNIYCINRVVGFSFRQHRINVFINANVFTVVRRCRRFFRVSVSGYDELFLAYHSVYILLNSG